MTPDRITLHTALLVLAAVCGSTYALGYQIGRKHGRLEAMRAIRRVDTLMHRWRTEQRP